MTLMKTLTAVAASAMMMTGMAANAADWKPKGPITIQIGFGAGGSTDALGRAIATEMEKQTGWDIVVENKPGGGGVAMFSSLVRAKPDGQKIGLGVTIPTLMNLALRGDKLPFKVDSFDYLGTIVVAPLAIVAPAKAPYNTFKEYVAHAKKKGRGLIGFDAKPQEMMMRAVNKTEKAGLEYISHKSGAEIVQSLLGGHVDIGFGAGIHIKYVNSGQLKMLAVATKTRQGYSKDTQSLIEQGYPYSVEPYFYFAAPKGLPADTKKALEAALDKAIKSDALAKLITNVMFTVPANLGAAGTEEKLTSGLDAVKKLVAATK